MSWRWRTDSSTCTGATRTLLTFYEQFDDPVAGLAMAREGLEVAARQGSARYGFQMVGNGVVCAIRTGDWDWADALLADWLSNEVTGYVYLELFVDRAIMTALRGGDPVGRHRRGGTTRGRASPIRSTPRTSSGLAHGRSLCAGRLDEAARQALAAVGTTSYLRPARPAPRRAAPLCGRATCRRRPTPRASIESLVFRGQALGLDLATVRAGIAALEGRRRTRSPGIGTCSAAGARPVWRSMRPWRPWTWRRCSPRPSARCPRPRRPSPRHGPRWSGSAPSRSSSASTPAGATRRGASVGRRRPGEERGVPDAGRVGASRQAGRSRSAGPT